MPMTPGLVPNIRLNAPQQADQPDPAEVIVEMADEGGDVPEFDQNGAILKIEHDDGSITVSLDGRPIEEGSKKEAGGWFDNLVDDISGLELNRISDELLRGIEDDLKSRQEWIEDRAQGIKLLGLKVEIPGLQGASDGAPVEGMSKVRHPLLLEAVLRFQANARSEMLPTDGPIKIRDDANNGTLEEDQMANALEQDLNHFLTAVASEYYPDTDRMLLMLGFGGTSFKKGYFCPLRNRPVIESVDADDLIVNNAATDLKNATRITHRSFMRPSTVKRLQILGVYKDMDLSQAQAPKLDAVQREKNAQQGLQPDGMRPEDRDREIYECYCELDIEGYNHRWKGKESGLEIPYRVTIDVSSKQILSIVRNYDEDDKQLPEPRVNFVKYTFVPGMGFYDIGLLHILGNTTNAITAAWRELLDAGMYSNFPGFLMSDAGGRQNTNIFRIPPGGGALVKTGGLPLSQAIMPLPYKEPSTALMSLVQDMAMTGMRIGGTSEQQVGEGRADAPVGTTLAMIEQSEKVMNAVHKRMHASQAEEFQMLARLFKEHPDSFWQKNKKPAMPWDEAMFLKALEDCDLVPQADPNTASHGQRVMKIMALKQLQAGNPALYDPIAIDVAALQAIGWSNPQQFMVPTDSLQQKTPPEVEAEMAKIQIKKQEADARTMVAQADVAEIQAKIQSGAYIPSHMTEDKSANHQIDTPVDKIDAHARMLSAQAKVRQIGIHEQEVATEGHNRAMDRQSRERIELLKMAKDLTMHPQEAPVIAAATKPAKPEGQ